MRSTSKLIFGFVASVLVSACGEEFESKQLPLKVEQANGDVTFSWDSTAVHMLKVDACKNEKCDALEPAWSVATATKLDDAALNKTEPTLEQGVKYGVAPAGDARNAAVVPLVEGRSYRVSIRRLRGGDCDAVEKNCLDAAGSVTFTHER